MDPVLILLKPDCLERRLWGRAMLWFEEQTDFEIHDMKVVHGSLSRLEAHYGEHRDKPFYRGLIGAMLNRPMIAMRGITKAGIPALRETVFRFRAAWKHPNATPPQNLIHCSDSAGAAVRETTIWFPIV